MNINDYLDLFDELDDFDQTDNILDKDKRRQRFLPRNPKRLPGETRRFIREQDDSSRSFNFTYKAARFEEWWLLDSLGDFYEHQWISDVLRRVEGGKEASVYQCRAGTAVGEDLLAAKVYRPRSLRNLKNDGTYRAGRADLDESGNAIVDDGALHAMQKRTAFGEELRHRSWIAYEFQTLQTLYEAGADVPAPYAMGNNAILMGFIGDAVSAAPALNTVRLEIDEAKALFERIVWNIDLMLAHDCIHGDLSAYNILYWEGEITLIDFPQVVLPGANPSAWDIFLRDVTRICQYFAGQGVPSDARQLAVELWTSHGHKIAKTVHPRHLNANDPKDRRIWEKQKISD